jgi:hypothetical protein
VIPRCWHPKMIEPKRYFKGLWWFALRAWESDLPCLRVGLLFVQATTHVSPRWGWPYREAMKCHARSRNSRLRYLCTLHRRITHQAITSHHQCGKSSPRSQPSPLTASVVNLHPKLDKFPVHFPRENRASRNTTWRSTFALQNLRHANTQTRPTCTAHLLYNLHS